MGLNIYFYDKDGNEIEDAPQLKITHNLNTLVAACGELKGISYYEAVWQPDTLLECKNGEVPVSSVTPYLVNLLHDLICYESVLQTHLPENGWGTYQWLIDFVCDYIKACYKYKDCYIYCCR